MTLLEDWGDQPDYETAAEREAERRKAALAEWRKTLTDHDYRNRRNP